MVDIDVLRWFQMVADGATVTEVGEIFMVSQPQVSRSLAALQREVGAPLLVRSGRVLRLTHAGSVFKRHVDRAVDEIDDGLADVDQLIDPERGTVTLAYEPSLGGWLVPSVVSGFRAAHPEVEFVLRHLGQEVLEAFDAVAAARIDLAFTADPSAGSGASGGSGGSGGDSAAVRWHRLFTEPFFLAVSAGHPLADRGAVDLAEAAAESFVGMGAAPLGILAANACRSAGFEPKVRFEADDLPTVRGFVAAGLGVALVPAMGPDFAAAPVPSGDLGAVGAAGVSASGSPGRYAAGPAGPRLLRLTDPTIGRAIGLAWSAQRRLLPAADLFRRHVLGEAAATRR